MENKFETNFVCKHNVAANDNVPKYRMKAIMSGIRSFLLSTIKKKTSNDVCTRCYYPQRHSNYRETAQADPFTVDLQRPSRESFLKYFRSAKYISRKSIGKNHPTNEKDQIQSQAYVRANDGFLQHIHSRHLFHCPTECYRGECSRSGSDLCRICEDTYKGTENLSYIANIGKYEGRCSAFPTPEFTESFGIPRSDIDSHASQRVPHAGETTIGLFNKVRGSVMLKSTESPVTSFPRTGYFRDTTISSLTPGCINESTPDPFQRSPTRRGNRGNNVDQLNVSSSLEKESCALPSTSSTFAESFGWSKIICMRGGGFSEDGDDSPDFETPRLKETSSRYYSKYTRHTMGEITMYLEQQEEGSQHHRPNFSSNLRYELVIDEGITSTTEPAPMRPRRPDDPVVLVSTESVLQPDEETICELDSPQSPESSVSPVLLIPPSTVLGTFDDDPQALPMRPAQSTQPTTNSPPSEKELQMLNKIRQFLCLPPTATRGRILFASDLIDGDISRIRTPQLISDEYQRRFSRAAIKASEEIVEAVGCINWTHEDEEECRSLKMDHWMCKSKGSF